MAACRFKIVIPQLLAATGPDSQTVCEGGDVQFAVTLMEGTAVGFQWKFNGDTLVDATNTVLTLSAVTTNDSGAYCHDARSHGHDHGRRADGITATQLREIDEMKQLIADLKK